MNTSRERYFGDESTPQSTLITGQYRRMSDVCRAGSMHAAAVPGSGARMRSRDPYLCLSLVFGPDLLTSSMHASRGCFVTS